tara:strand:+ start:3052 stop:3276 length:225 start_codon:yes stop_codon:yes gene_type:complete
MGILLFATGVLIYTYLLLTLIAHFQVRQQIEIYESTRSAAGKGLTGRTILEAKRSEKQESLSRPHLLVLRYFKK